MEDGPIDHAEFANAEVHRTRATAQALARRVRAAHRNAVAFARTLKADFGVTEVVLFGSLVHPERFTMRSDIDLAVRGLPERWFLRAYGMAVDSPIPIDLLDLDGDLVRPEIRERIRREGQVLE